MTTEGLRYNTGKVPLEMVPLHLLEGTARVFYDVTTREVNPYPKWNWTLDKEWSVPYACALRHLSKWFAGEDVDSETGHSHISHAICNLLMLEHYRTSCPQMDDRPKKEFTKDANFTAQTTGVGRVGEVPKGIGIAHAIPPSYPPPMVTWTIGSEQGSR